MEHEHEPKRWSEVIAIYNMCCFGGFHGLFNNETDCYVYETFNDKKVLKDLYNKPLYEETIENVINFLENHKEKESYRRVKPLLGLLKGFEKTKWVDLAVLHFGC